MKKFLLALLWIAFFCFWFDLFHMFFHLSKAPVLWQVSGIGGKFLLKTVLFLIPLVLLLQRKSWMTFLFLCFFFNGSQPTEAAFWGTGKTACQSAREMLQESGTAKDAKESLFGKIKLTPPEERFPRDADQVTWWGKFHPFEFWQSPEFKAQWLDPQGQQVAQQTFKGAHCALAKSGIQADNVPRGEFQPGVWKVLITCDDYLIDQRFFEVAGPRNVQLPSGPAADAGKAVSVSPESVTIWAKDKV